MFYVLLAGIVIVFGKKGGPVPRRMLDRCTVYSICDSGNTFWAVGVNVDSKRED